MNKDIQIKVKVVEAKKEDRDTMLNLLEKYLYEFSQWEKTDVKEDGLYGYEYLDCYFEEDNRYPNHEVDYEDGTPADVFFFEN